MYPDNNMPNTCGDACGTMPECAPLAVPYVPFQQTNPKRYSQQDALNNGTLFPGLNLPFRVKPDAAKVMGGALAELQALGADWPLPTVRLCSGGSGRATRRPLSSISSMPQWKKRPGRNTRP